MDIKAIFEFDLIIGTTLGWFIDIIFAGMKQQYTGGFPGLPRWIPATLDVNIDLSASGLNSAWGPKTDDWIAYVVTLLPILFLTGKWQRYFIIAFWTQIAIKLGEAFVR